MDRKEFFKKSCYAGLCACAGFSMISGDSFAAISGQEPAPDDWRIGFMQRRFSKMVDYMNAKLDNDTREKMIEQIGRYCSMEAEKDYEKMKGNVEGYLDHVKSTWAEDASFDKEKGVITITGKKSDSCFCPFAGKKSIAKEFCNCSIGWQKQTLETLTGKKVAVNITSSILQGGERCCFLIQLS